MASKSPENEYPLHWLVWHNDYVKLESVIAQGQYDIELLDPRGRAPLMLAVTLGHLECTRVLLRHDANVNVVNKGGWTVVQEAVATGDPELLQEIIARRDYQRYTGRVGGIPGLLQKLQDAPDFYIEMKWEFTSWVPIVSRLCPSDIYKVYKSGSNVRIDTTLLGFGQTDWQRGNRSYIFKGQRDTATMVEIDHDAKQVYSEQMWVATPSASDVTYMRPSDDIISARLTTPIVSTYIDTEKISFERNKSGIWGWRSDKLENINNYECKVFSISNVELVTRTRTEHLTEADKAKNRPNRSPFQSFLGIAEYEAKSNASATNGEVVSLGNPCNITPDEYFNPSFDLDGRDIGRPREISTKLQKFKANLWLSDQYPLSLQEQILPIVDLMAVNSSHFAKLKDFITLQLPAGFPVKIEIPLFHVLNARITFGNVFGLDDPVTGVTNIREEDGIMCVIDDICFESPQGYLRLGSSSRRQFSIDEDDELLQFAIQQSLIEAGTENDQVTVWEALKNQQPSLLHNLTDESEEDHHLQRAIQESLALSQLHLLPRDDENEAVSNAVPLENDLIHLGSCVGLDDEQLQLAISLSEQTKLDEEQRLKQEEEMLQQILELSLTDK